MPVISTGREICAAECVGLFLQKQNNLDVINRTGNHLEHARTSFIDKLRGQRGDAFQSPAENPLVDRLEDFFVRDFDHRKYFSI